MSETKLVSASSSRNFLPHEFIFRHNFCFFLHDLLVQAVALESQGVFEAPIKFKNEQEFESVQMLHEGSDLYQWLQENGHQDVIKDMNYKQIFVALLSDSCHFIYEALQCSRKGKLTVSYNLLRKPFKENLFILEWLLADPNELLESFSSADKQKLNIDRFPETRKIEIIKKAISKTRYGNWIDAQFIHDLRYKKDEHYTFENVWHKAVHLTTTHRAVSTEPENFNFVFSGKEARYSQWQQIYTVLPILLKHFSEVVHALLSTISDSDFVIDLLRSDIGFIHLHKIDKSQDSLQFDFERDIGKEFLSFLDFNSPKCEKCNKEIVVKDEILKAIYELEFDCPHCGFCNEVNINGEAADTFIKPNSLQHQEF